MSGEENFLAIISSLGFPAAVSFYLLVKISGSLENLTRVIVKLDAKLDEKMDGLHDFYKQIHNLR